MHKVFEKKEGRRRVQRSWPTARFQTHPASQASPHPPGARGLDLPRRWSRLGTVHFWKSC